MKKNLLVGITALFLGCLMLCSGELKAHSGLIRYSSAVSMVVKQVVRHQKIRIGLASLGLYVLSNGCLEKLKKMDDLSLQEPGPLAVENITVAQEPDDDKRRLAQLKKELAALHTDLPRALEKARQDGSKAGYQKGFWEGFGKSTKTGSYGRPLCYGGLRLAKVVGACGMAYAGGSALRTWYAKRL